MTWLFLKVPHQQLPTLNAIFLPQTTVCDIKKKSRQAITPLTYSDQPFWWYLELTSGLPSVSHSSVSHSILLGKPTHTLQPDHHFVSSETAEEFLSLSYSPLFKTLLHTVWHDTSCLRESSVSSQMKTENYRIRFLALESLLMRKMEI